MGSLSCGTTGFAHTVQYLVHQLGEERRGEERRGEERRGERERERGEKGTEKKGDYERGVLRHAQITLGLIETLVHNFWKKTLIG